MELTLDQALKKGIEAHKAGQFQDADRYYTAILKVNPKHPDANHNMGVLTFSLGKVEAALPFFKTALESNPQINQFWLSYIDTLIKLNLLDDAKAVLDQARDKGAQGDGFDKLEKQLTPPKPQSIAQAQDPPQDQLKSLINLYTKGQNQEALTQASQLLNDFPNSINLYNIIGAANKGLGKLSEAITAYNKALSIKPDYAVAYNNIGNALKEQGELNEAIAAYNKALSIKPDYAVAYNSIGNALKEQGELNEAIAAYNKALSIKPDYVVAYNNMGISIQEQGKTEEALEVYKKAISIKPDNAEAYYNMGNALQDQRKLEEAIKAYNKAISLKPECAEAYSNKGSTLQDQGKLDEAIDTYTKAISINPDFAEAYYNMGVTLQEVGRLNEALEAYKKALAIKPDYADAYYNMGNTLEEQLKSDEAVVSFQKAFEFRSGIVPKYDKALAPGTTGLLFELTNKCNFHCVFCPSDSQKRKLGSMDIELEKKLYTEASEKKLASYVNLHLMGEPTLHPKLIEILNFGASKNIKTDLVTNGSTLVAKLVPKILDSLYGTITASHMTPTEETYHFRGKVGLSWERYISNLRLLIREYMKRIAQGDIRKNDITIRVMSTMNTAANCTITDTADEARAILKEWSDFVASVEKELGLESFKRMDYNAHDILKGNGRPAIDYPLQKGVKLTFWRAFTFANTRLSDEYELEDIGETAYCPRPFKDVGVLWNGDVTLCCLDHDGELSVGNIKDSSIEEIIQNDASQKLRASMLGRCSLPSVCKTCQARPVKTQNPNKEESPSA